MRLKSNNQFRSLGSGNTVYKFDGPDAKILESFANPFAETRLNKNSVDGTIHIEAPEFTSLCPITGQPDFATIVIDYRPGKKCVESKSLKLYLMSFRMHGEFHESCVNRIANDLIDLLKPDWIRVEGRFTPRGGISFWPVAENGSKK
ncbi:MAG: NADPH-dependent 7-cyano-7-deazaguanine reductase QueF [Nitrospinae bacterium]|nr:NADPH-dependent 7-cyano-7-deazaguanine reductase QueF [Nitrospinota bacterium]